ncbi:MAG: nicotinamide mononucleotide transporter family protein [Chitinophagales bacterium]|jgi:hypothetical protein|nr:nicotinamide mononucleotide transporter family protein [Chitinophagales bacterium]
MYKRSKLVRAITIITNGVELDVIGVFIVVGGSIFKRFHEKIVDINIESIGLKIVDYPVGLQSIVTVCISLLTTRLVTKRNNFGHLLAIFNTISVGMIDYLLGNKAAFITYPVTMLGTYWAYYNWGKKREVIPIALDAEFYINFIIGFAISLGLNYLGYTEFFTKSIENFPLFVTTVIIVGLTFSGQLNGAKKYKDNWFTWQFYNAIKLVQNVMMMNWAQILKYLYYFLNALFGWITWNDLFHRKKAEEEYYSQNQANKG